MTAVAHIFGTLAVILAFIIYQQTERKRIIILKMVADIMWVLHYLFIGAYAGVVTNTVGTVREYVFSKRGSSKYTDSKIIPIIFIAASWMAGIFAFKSPISILPIIASSCVSVALWMKNPRLTKALSLPISLMYLIYNIFVGSIMGICNEIFVISSIIISFIARENNIFQSFGKNRNKNTKKTKEHD